MHKTSFVTQGHNQKNYLVDKKSIQELNIPTNITKHKIVYFGKVVRRVNNNQTEYVVVYYSEQDLLALSEEIQKSIFLKVRRRGFNVGSIIDLIRKFIKSGSSLRELFASKEVSSNEQHCTIDTFNKYFNIGMAPLDYFVFPVHYQMPKNVKYYFIDPNRIVDYLRMEYRKAEANKLLRLPSKPLALESFLDYYEKRNAYLSNGITDFGLVSINETYDLWIRDTMFDSFEKIGKSTLYWYLYNEKHGFLLTKHYLNKYKEKPNAKKRIPRKSIFGAELITVRNSLYKVKSEVGHFETDSVIGLRNDKQSMITFREIGGHIFSVRLYDNSAEDFAIKLVEMIREAQFLGREIKTLTFDNGKENWKIYETLKANNLGYIKLFYTHAYASSDKAEIERSHRKLRQFFKKKTSFNNIGPEYLKKAENYIREITGFWLSKKLTYLNNVSVYDKLFR